MTIINLNLDIANKFVDKIKYEAPEYIETSIGANNLIFYLLDSDEFYDQESLLEYQVNINGVDIIFQIQYWDHNNNKYRFEIRTPEVRSYQITCFHFNKLGFFEDRKTVEISQIVKVSGQGGSKRNNSIKLEACKLLEQEGLLIKRENKSPRWHIGDYNIAENKWMYEQNTKIFLEKFLKVAIIMAHARGNRGFSLITNSIIDDFEDKQSRYPITNKRKVDPCIFKSLLSKWEEIGAQGEEYVFQKEKEKLIKIGRSDLAENIKHVSLEDCAAGFDIYSYDSNGKPIYIECKSSEGFRNGFEISVNEWNTAMKYREQYFIYHIINISSRPEIIKFQDPLKLMENNVLTLKPSAFSVKY